MKTMIVERIEDRAVSEWCRVLSRSCRPWVMEWSCSLGQRDLGVVSLAS